MQNDFIDWNSGNQSLGWSDTDGSTFWVSQSGQVSNQPQSGFTQIATSFMENVAPALVPLVFSGQTAQLSPTQQQQLHQMYPQYFAPNPQVELFKYIVPLVALYIIFKK